MNKFEEIASILIRDIKEGQHRGKLPSERELAKLYNTTPVTAAKALNYLQEKNLVIRKRGDGTFVKSQPERTKIRMLMQNEFLREGIESLLVSAFPDISFVFSHSAGNNWAENFKSNDIVWLCGSVAPGSYDSLCRPLPLSFVREKMESSNYSGEAFNIHRCRSHYYGAPVLCSPTLLSYNKTLFKKCGLPIPEKTLTGAQIHELKKAAGQKGVFLFDSQSLRFPTVMNCVFASLPSGVSLSGMSWSQLEIALKEFESLHAESASAKTSFLNGNALFSYNCRQTIERYINGKTDFEWDIIPVFHNGTPRCTVASESCFVSANSPAADAALLTVIDFLMGEKSQKLIEKNHFGIPVLKSAALDSMRSVPFRDDYFFSESRNIVFDNTLFEKDSLWIFSSLINDYFDGIKNFKEFNDGVQTLFNSDRMMMSAQKNLNFKMEV
jgi:DNA-binding transcriptional regulator YhcF (GntR family)